MAQNRDDFTEKIKRKLGDRVGWKCSNPDCGRPTRGPHTDPHKSVSIGVASHICAAASGGARYDEHMLPADRASIENGIWLCQSCSVMIDKDDKRYPISLLKQWKKDAESKALFELERRKTPVQRGAISVSTKNNLISSARILMDNAERFHAEYQGYKIAVHYNDDKMTYNICVAMVNAIFKLIEIEHKNHLQLQALGLDKTIIELKNLLPDFHDENSDGTGSTMVYTLQNYLTYFTSDESKNFIKRCRKIIKVLETL